MNSSKRSRSWFITRRSTGWWSTPTLWKPRWQRSVTSRSFCPLRWRRAEAVTIKGAGRQLRATPSEELDRRGVAAIFA